MDEHSQPGSPADQLVPPTPAADVVHPYEQTLRSRRLLMRIIRISFVILFAVITGLSLFGGGLAAEGAAEFWPITLVIAVVVAFAVILVDLLTPAKRLSTIAGVLLGLLAAMLATAAIGFIIDLLAETYGQNTIESPLLTIIKVLIGIGLAYLAIATIVQTQDDFRLVIPYVEFAKQIRGPRPLLLDSSAVIDGRIAAIYETGLIQAPLVVPRFVVEELHGLADSSDKLKRARGRRALDLIGRMQRSANVDITIDETPVPGKSVDLMLVELARQMPGVIVTTDTGLARVAQIHDTPTINLNEIANAMKPEVIPGERVRVRIIKPGEHAGQGVGYLDDGTMVVAEDGGGHIGEDHHLYVTSSMQTSAGRLIFARVQQPDSREHTPDAHTPEPSHRPADAAAAARPGRNPRR